MEEVIKIDKLGPIIINSDGTMSRIENWANLSDRERENSLRLIAKRNKLRREALQAKENHENVSSEIQPESQVIENSDGEILALEYK